MLHDSRFITLWTALLLLLGSERAFADEAGAPIPLAELGARADAEAPSAAPALSDGRVTLPAPLQALRGELDATGLSVDSTSASEGGGRFRLTPARLDKGGEGIDLPAGRVSLRQRTAVLERGPLTELLTASGDGLRQDFMVAQPPEGDAPLTLTLALEGATAQTVTNGVGLTLPGGRELVYHGLRITDASGRVLDGALTARDARTLAITVADASARYPLTIDPTISDTDWFALGDGLDGAVYALLMSGSDLYVGGEFTMAGGNSANRIAKWDGSAWSALGNGVSEDQYSAVFSLAVSGGALYVGGWFDTAGGKPANNIAKWTLGATGDAGWSALGDGLNGNVNALAVSGSNLYVGGNFSTAGVVSANKIAKWNGSVWSALGSGLNIFVSALAVSGSDLYVGGFFTTAGSSPASRIAKWNLSATDDNGWSALGSGVSGNTDPGVTSLAIFGDDLYVGGRFTQAGISPASRIAKWNLNANNDAGWSALGSGVSEDEYSAVFSLAVSGGALYVGGQFIQAGGSPANYIAAWSLGATSDDGWSALGNGTNYIVQTLAVSGDALFVGGQFTSAGSVSANRVARVDLPPCGFGIPLTTSPVALWQQLALPCVPSVATPSVTNVFGNSPTANLDNDLYNVANTGWILYRRDVTTNPPSYVKLNPPESATLAIGDGYWIKSYAAPVDGKLTVAGTATPTDATTLQGCAVAAGCKVVTLTTVDGQNRYNLVGNPFPYAVDWSKVRVRVTEGSNYDVYSPCQAAGIETGCTGPAAAVANPAVISNVINIWNGNDYQSFTDLDGSGNLEYFKSFWVNVLPGAFGIGKTVELLIPAQTSTLSQATPTAIEPLASAELPWYLAWLDWVAPPAHAAAPNADDWRVQLKLLNHVTQWKSGTVKLGQMGLAQPGYDPHDVPKLAPFGTPYLSLVFPHPEWGAQAGDYGTDFRPALGKQPQNWTFEVRADPIGSVVFLSWEGDAKKLKRMRLIDLQTGKTIKPADKRWAKKGYPITLKSPVQRYVWRYLGK